MKQSSASDAPEFYVQFAIDVLEGRLARIDMDLADLNWQPGRREIEIACNAMRSAIQLLEKINSHKARTAISPNTSALNPVSGEGV